jgi:hypothetical protein
MLVAPKIRAGTLARPIRLIDSVVHPAGDHRRDQGTVVASGELTA